MSTGGGGLSHLTPNEPQSAPSPLEGEGWGGGCLFDSAGVIPPSRLARSARDIAMLRIASLAKLRTAAEGRLCLPHKGGGNRSELAGYAIALPGGGGSMPSEAGSPSRSRDGVPGEASGWGESDSPTPAGLRPATSPLQGEVGVCRAFGASQANRSREGGRGSPCFCLPRRLACRRTRRLALRAAVMEEILWAA